MSLWCSMETAPRDFVCLWWVVPKTAEEAYCDTSGNPIVARSLEPRMVMGKHGHWSSLMKAIYWHPLPNPPTQNTSSGVK